MKKIYKATFLSKRFFQILIALVLLFILAFFFERLQGYLVMGFFILCGLLLVDLFLLYRSKNGVDASRVLPDKFSNGDENPVEIKLRNNYGFKAYYRIIDELPIQFQVRDFKIEKELSASQATTMMYTARPVERGEFHFGSLNVFVKSITICF